MALRRRGDQKIRLRHRGYDNIANSVKPNLNNARLYGILDLSYVDDSDAVSVAEAMIKGGVDLIQLRGKKRSIDELAELPDK